MSVHRSPQQLVSAALIGVVAISVMVAIALNLQRLPLVGSGETYRAEFSDASGLVVGEEVRIAGIKVGTVKDLELQRGKVIAEFTVKDTALGDHTTASIEIKTVLGQHYLGLVPEGPGALEPGSTIPLRRTTSPLNVVPAFQRLTTDVQKIDVQQLAEGLDAVTETVRATAPQLEPTLRGLRRLSTTVVTRDQQLRELFGDARIVAETVADRDDDLRRLLPASARVLEMLEDRSATINRIIRGIRALATELTALIEANQDQLGPVLTDLNSVLAVLQANKQQLDDTIRYARQYARVFVPVAGSGRWLDTIVEAPNGFAICRNEPSSPPSLATLLDPVLSSINQASTGDSEPCLPLSPPERGAGQ